MKLKLVGTGAILGKDRSACSLVDNKILIDCGNGLLKTLIQQGVNILRIEAVLITHLHADHIFDLPFFIFNKYLLKANKELKIYCPKGTEKAIELLCSNFVFTKKESYFDMKQEGKYTIIEFEKLENEEIIKDYFVTAYSVSHGDFKNAYGYTIKNGNKCVGFSGDSVLCDNIIKIVENSNVAVLDMTKPQNNSAHMGVDNIEEISKKYSDKKIISTHASPLAKEEARKRNIKNLFIANDGDEIEF